MELVFATIIIVTGLSVNQYLFYKHISRLEILLKANSSTEAKEFINTFNNKPIQEVLSVEPKTLQDLVDDQPAEQIRVYFRKPE